MKKTLCKLLLAGSALLGVSTAANAQLAVGSVAPDFTLTDINGQSQQLYKYLDSGYTVIMDISAAWCGPCWAVHNSGVLKTLYNEYGPNGTVSPKKIMVLFVEGEAQNTTAQLHGTGTTPPATYADGTQGDWVTGEPYPFIDNATLNSVYQIGGFPTFTIVCPNRTVAFAIAGYNQAMLNKSFWLPYMQNCPVATQPTDGSVMKDLAIKDVVCPGNMALSAPIQNMGTSPLTAATVEALIGGNVVATQNWTGNLAKYGIATVNFTGTGAIAAGTNNVQYKITVGSDANASNNTQNYAVKGSTTTNKTLRLEVNTDAFPGETEWKVFDDNNAVVASHKYTAGTGTNGQGGPDAQRLFQHYLDLDANKCYRFQITDTYGDGLTGVPQGQTIGNFKLYDANTMVFNIGGDFGKSAESRTLTGSAVNGIESFSNVESFKLYPNPAASFVNIDLTTNEAFGANMQIVNMVGQVVKTLDKRNFTSGFNRVTIDTKDLANGIYMLQMESNGQVKAERFTISK